MPLDMDHLYVFTNIGIDNIADDSEKKTVGNVVKKHNVLKSAVKGFHVTSDMFLKNDQVK